MSDRTTITIRMLDTLENIAKPGGVRVPLTGHCREIFALGERRLLRVWDGPNVATANELLDGVPRRGELVTPSLAGLLVLAAWKLGEEGRP